MLVAFSIVNVLSCKANKNCYHSKKKKKRKKILSETRWKSGLHRERDLHTKLMTRSAFNIYFISTDVAFATSMR